jgi:hypothetical protein
MRLRTILLGVLVLAGSFIGATLLMNVQDASVAGQSAGAAGDAAIAAADRHLGRAGARCDRA